MTSLEIDSYNWDSMIIYIDAVDWAEPVYEELLRLLENNEWQSCTQFSKSEMQMPWDSQSMSASRMANGDGE